MGQATLDLPDPSQLSGVDAGPMSPEALASADDLLSQLAGDDIDRLLAEADAERPAPPVAVPAAPPAAAPAAASAVEILAAPALEIPAVAPVIDSEAATAAAIEAVLAPAIESTLKAVVAADGAPAVPDASSPVAIDSASQIIATPDVAVEVAPAHAAEGSFPVATPEAEAKALDEKILDEAAAHVASIMEVPPAAVEPDPATLAAAAQAQQAIAERQALSEPLVVPQPAAKTGGPVSWLVRILELINSPMQLFSDQVRDAMGKVALLTMFNAAAVIVYVLVFRRPHR